MCPQKQCFWHQHTKTSQFDDNPLFTIQNLCFHGAKATKISTIWYPQSPIQLQSSTAGAKISIFPWMWGMGGLGWWCQAASFAAKLVPRCQNIKISFAREAPGASTLGSPSWASGIIKRDFSTKKATRRHMTITRYLQYKTSVFMVPRPPKYQYFGTPKAAKQ